MSLPGRQITDLIFVGNCVDVRVKWHLLTVVHVVVHVVVGKEEHDVNHVGLISSFLARLEGPVVSVESF